MLVCISLSKGSGVLSKASPTHWRGVQTGGRGPGKLLPPSPFPAGHIQSPDAGGYLHSGQVGGAGDPQPNYFGMGDLDILLCCHKTPGCSSLGHNIVQDRGSIPYPDRETCGYPVPTYAQRTSGAGWGHERRPQTVCSSTETGNQDKVVAHRKDVHSEWNRAGISVMAWCPIPLLRHRSPRSPFALWWLKCHLLNISCTEIQEGQTYHDLS